MLSGQEKIKAILESVKRFSGRQIDVAGKGKGVTKLARGEKVSEEKLDVMYRKILELERGTERQKTTKDKSKTKDNVDKNKTNFVDKKDKYQDKIRELELANTRLKEEVGQLQSELAGIGGKVVDLENKTKILEEKASQPGEEKTRQEGGAKAKLPEKILGFSIICKKTSTDGKVYFKWYAHRRIEDRQQWIYLGKDTTNAQEKVRAWLSENHPDLLSSLG